MATIRELTQTALATLSLPVQAGQYLADTPGGNLPDTYLVHKMVDILPEQHADDAETLRNWLVQGNVYSRADPSQINVIGAMHTAGFTFVDERDLDPDTESGHSVIAYDFEYL